MNPNAAAFTPSWLKTEEPKSTVAEEMEEEIVYTANEQAQEPAEDLVEKMETVQVSSETNGDHPPPSDARMNETAAEAPKDERKKVDEAVDHPTETETAEPVEVEEEVVGDGKKTINLVFIGHVDAGKSTIGGRILTLTGEVDERTMEKNEKEAKATGRESWKYAWALDLNQAEREKGKTEECGRASFRTETHRFVILDAPGHKSFVPHMIGGASQADIAILIISTRRGEFETGFERGGQTREHAMLAKTSGVRQLVVVMNKMDDPSIIGDGGVWSKDRFEECKKKLAVYLKQVGWKSGDVTWLPLSGWTGENIKDRVSEAVCPWYSGESLIDTLEHLEPPERLMSGPVRLPVFEKYKDMGSIVMGKLESGTLRVNQKLTMMPNRTEVVVDTMTLETQEVSKAEPGDNVRLRLRGIEEDEIRTGFVLCYPPSNVVPAVMRFNARLMILEHKSIIAAGYSAVMHIHAAVEEFTIEKLLAELDRRGEVAKRNIKFAKPGMTVVARLRLTSQPICIEPFKDFPQLGRFMVRTEGVTVAVGVVLKVIETA